MSLKSRRRARIEAAKAKPASASRDKPREFRASAGIPATIRAAEGEGDGKKLPTFAGNAYTGAPMRPEGWGLPIIVDLDGVKVPSQSRPVLRQHDHNKIVGHTESVTVSKKGIEMSGVVSNPDSEQAKEVVGTAGNKFPWQLSIGANPTRTEFLEAGEETEVNGRTVTGPMTISRETELGEISFVPLGADGDTSAVVSASKGSRSMFKAMLLAAKKAGNILAGKYSEAEIDEMSEADAKKNFKKCMAEEEKKTEAEDEEKTEGEDEEKTEAADDSTDDGEKKTEAKAAAQREIKSIMAAFRAEMGGLRKETAKELRRQSEVKTIAAKYGVSTIEVGGKKVDLVAHAIGENWNSDKVELEALRAARPTAGGPHFHFPNTPIVNEAVLECAVFDALPQFKLFDSDFYRVSDNGRRRVAEREEKKITAELNSRYTDEVRQAAHTHFKGRIGLQQLLTTLAAGNGYRGPATFNDPNGWGEVAGYLGQPIRADAASTVNTPATLANVQNKFMLQGYMYTELAYLDFCSVLPTKDLKPTKSVQLFGDFVFKPLNPGGEIHHASVGDNPYANQATLQARMVTLELQYLINDDLGMFGQVPMMLGRGWGLRVNDLVYTKLLSPGFDDGGSTNFFAATHTIAGQSANANYQKRAGSTLTSDGLKAAKILLDRQVDPNNKKIGVDAEILLYPPELDVAAIELMNAQFIVMAGLASTSSASKQANTNIWKGRFKPVMSRYLSDSAFSGYSTTGWYLLVNPAVYPVIQIAALNGQMTPTVQTASQDWQFNQLGISMRGWGGVGVSMQNFRGGVLSAGA